MKALSKPLLALAALVLAGAAAPGDDDRAGLEALRVSDLRVATIAYRLATAAVDSCPTRRTPLPGWLVGDASQYSPGLRPQAAALFGLADGPAIVGLVPGGAAERGGVKAGDRLVAINGEAIPPSALRPGDGESYARVGAILASLDAAFAAGPVRLDLVRGGQPLMIALTGQPGCASTIQVEPSNSFFGKADGKTVSISSALADFAVNDDELAFLVAHELAHNILDHRKRLDAQGVARGLFRSIGKNPGRIRATEMEADYFALYLTAWAGYDPDAAPGFWARFGKQHGLGILADGTHMGDRARVVYIQRGVAELRAKQAKGEPLSPDLAGLPAGK